MSDIDKKDQRICKKCLLRDFDEAAYEEQIRRFIEKLSPGDRVSHEEYEKRLLVCQSCESLVTGTCMKCGCYVELRAAGKNSRCPAKKW